MNELSKDSERGGCSQELDLPLSPLSCPSLVVPPNVFLLSGVDALAACTLLSVWGHIYVAFVCRAGQTGRSVIL